MTRARTPSTPWWPPCPKNEEVRRRAALEGLVAWSEERRGLVLMIDNVDLLLTRLETQHWALREVMSEHHHLVWIVASAQQLTDALAIGWDPMTAAQVASATRLEINLVSAQLNRLVQQGVVEKVPLPAGSRAGFQIAERFFNIWYLMRASRRVRRRLEWLVRFLELLSEAEEHGRAAVAAAPDDLHFARTLACVLAARGAWAEAAALARRFISEGDEEFIADI